MYLGLLQSHWQQVQPILKIHFTTALGVTGNGKAIFDKTPGYNFSCRRLFKVKYSIILIFQRSTTRTTPGPHRERRKKIIVQFFFFY